MLLVGSGASFASAFTKALAGSSLHLVWVPSPSGLVERPEFRYQGGLFAPVLVIVDLARSRFGPPEALIGAVRNRFAVSPIVALVATSSEQQARRLFRFRAAALPSAIAPWALATLAYSVSYRAETSAQAVPAVLPTALPVASERRRHMDLAIDTYAAMRSLSRLQKTVLRLYLSGHSDKQIATINGCAEATVYEHWRRMARKANVFLKSDVIADFHRFLAGD